MKCDIEIPGGSLANCTLEGEEPAGQGFGQALLSLSPAFKVRPLMRDGVPEPGGTVRVPVRFLPR
jgi:hypothetical protein